MVYFIYLMISFVLSVFFTLLCIKIARRYNIVDIPNERKIHKEPVPYLGGIAIFLSFMITFIIGLKTSSLFNLEERIIGVLVAGTLIFLFGLYDDLKGSHPFFKFFIQIVVALILVSFGFIIDRVTNPFGGHIMFPGWLSVILTVFWIIAIINAVNLLDGLDGLASGVIGIASFFVFFISLTQYNYIVAFISIILIGSSFGFLLFNFPPAKIFMGDAGSMFLGFIFSVLAILGNRKSAVALSLLIPIVLLSIPILDTLLAIIRRANKKKNIFEADKEHIHHRLINLGIPYKKVILLIYVVCVYLGFISFLSVWLPKEFIFTLMLIVGINIMIGLYVLKLVEDHVKK
ncbi:MAG: undecaprenyl/decaprenyl-phosphate alpha-N-acetylglucosaminyl 1-phosphate transferase, partial [Spirochaetes bacterium]|nr:undecaprenyl/decaprenyl-phosphate alpha-N-acetylglucosaminyl 1-phosphate transferase [Spirochaetota bacterium]